MPAVAPNAVQPVSASSSTAQVAAPSGAYRVVVTALRPCWVEATDRATGKVEWAGSLESGAQQAITLRGSVDLQLGAAGAAVSLDGTPVGIPASYQAPYLVVFTAA